MTSKSPIQAADVAVRVWYAGTDREVHTRALCDVGGRSKVGVGLLALPPGSHTKPAHYHTMEEEHLYVLEGAATLHLGTETHRLMAGSYVCFPAGQPLPHYLHNDSSLVFRYLMVGERLDEDTVIYD